MNWFEGNIADAVALSKSTNKTFVVYVQGTDDMSNIMSTVLDSSEVSSKLASPGFICIKLTKDSKSHQQFTEIYKIVPVPSLFFIGINGVPMEIIPGDNVIDNVSKKVNAAISKLEGNPDLSASPGPVSPTSNSPSTAASVSGIEVKKETPASSVGPSSPVSSSPLSSSPVSPSSSEPTVEITGNHIASAPPEEVVAVESLPANFSAEEEKVKAAEMERVQELIKKKRDEAQKQEEEREKERELSRRRMGKEIAQARKSQQDRELEEMKRERERDRKLEAEARQRVLRQIEEDKANRAARANQALSSSTTSASQSTTPDTQKQTAHRSSLTSQSNETRIQFKLPDGQTRTQTFPSNTTIRDLRAFIDSNIDIPFKEYTLATTFPRREFTSRDLNRDLIDLELVPSSVLLILPVQGNIAVMRGGPGWTTTLSAMFWALIQPVLDIGSYLKSLITGGGPSSGTSASTEPNVTEEQPSTSNTPQQQEPISRPPFYNSLGGGKSVRKRGNIHSLADGNDSNDENNTWNGNSTQQM